MLATTSPFPQFFDLDGEPLNSGSLFFGVANQNPETNPITVYWDAAGTQPASQPIQTINGFIVRNGTPATLFANSDYSLNVRNLRGNLVFYAPKAADANLAVSLSASSGSSLVGFIQSGAGAVSRTSQEKMRESISVMDYGADPTGAADSYAAFSSAITALDASGGKIRVGPGIWNLSSTPTWGTKSVFWDIDPSATFTGAGTGVGKFPYMSTNTAQLAVGPFIQSQTSVHSANPNGGVAALNVEMIQPSTYGAGQSVGIFAGAKSANANAAGNVWAINCLIKAETGAGGTYQCIEVDVDCYSSGALMKGISITGVGSANPDVGLEVVRAQGTWDRGVHILNSQDSLVIAPVSGGRGVVVGATPAIGNTAITARQLANNVDVLLLQRQTDTAPTGYFLRGVNAANNASLVLIDVLGNITGEIFSGSNIRARSVASAGAANEFTIGNGLASTATAGGNGATPAQVAQYLVVYHGGTKLKIPMYND